MRSHAPKLLYVLVIILFLASAILLIQVNIKPVAFGKTTANVGVCIGQKPVLDPVENEVTTRSSGEGTMPLKRQEESKTISLSISSRRQSEASDINARNR